MLVEGIDISDKDHLNLTLINREVFAVWVSIVGSFLLFQSASYNRIIIKNKYTNEIPPDQLPNPLTPALISLILSVFTGVWTLDVVVNRFNEVKKDNQTSDTPTNLEPPYLIVISAIVSIISLALVFKAALLKREQEGAQIIILGAT